MGLLYSTEESASPGTPAAGKVVLYFKSDGFWYFKDDSGVEVPFAQGTAATQAQQEAATSTTTYVSPGRQQYHPSAVKAWAQFTDGGTASFGASYNFSSIDDDGTGDYGLNYTTAFSSANYAATMMADSTGNRMVFLNNNLTTSLEIDVKVCTTGASSNVLWGSVILCGDQA
jgi:hypothetical protein